LIVRFYLFGSAAAAVAAREQAKWQSWLGVAASAIAKEAPELR
jgi:hypothetical protein